MKLSDLETGMQVELRDGYRFTIFRDMLTSLYGKQSVLLVGDNLYLPGEKYNEDLTHIEEKMSDIVKIFKGHCIHKIVDFNTQVSDSFLIWERPIAKPDYIELQNQAGFKVGDFVKVAYKITDEEKIAIGWELNWTDYMDATIGYYGKIINISNCGVRVDINSRIPKFTYPFTVLEKVGHES